jgi:hypothetical protein
LKDAVGVLWMDFNEPEALLGGGCGERVRFPTWARFF